MLDMALHRLLEVLGGLVYVAVPLVQRGPGRPPLPDDPQAILENPRRREIYELIEAHPGISGIEIQHALDLGGGVLENHLNRLLRAGLLETRRSGRFLRLYAIGQAPPPNDPVLLPETTKTVARAVLAGPGRSIEEVASEVGLSYKRTSEHLRQLVHLGLVTSVPDGRPGRHGRRVCHEPTDLLRRAAAKW